MLFDNINRFIRNVKKLIGTPSTVGSNLPGEPIHLRGGDGDGAGVYATGTLTVNVTGLVADIYITDIYFRLLASPNGLTADVARVPGSNNYNATTGTTTTVATSIADAINDPLNAFSTYLSATSLGNVVTIQAVDVGLRGNNIQLATSNPGPSGITPSGPNLTGGVNSAKSGPIVLDTVANGNGTVQADLGGDDRGVGAVDFQVLRASSSQVAAGDQSLIAAGQNNTTTVTGIGAFVTGDGNVASGAFSTVEGSSSVAQGFASHAEGSSVANGGYSHSEGMSEAGGEISHAEGNATFANANYTHTEGNATSANDTAAHAEGDGATAGGPAAHAEGFSTVAGNNVFHVGAHAEGQGSSATAVAAHAEGYFTIVGPESVGGHAEGKNTVVGGDGSHAEGDSTTSTGGASHSEGTSTTALGYSSHAGGIGSYVQYTADAGHAIGRYSGVTNWGEFATASGMGSGTQSSLGQLPGGVQTSIIDVQALTTDATPKTLKWGDITGIQEAQPPGDSAWGTLVIVTARDHGNGDSATFMFQALWRNGHLSNSLTLVGSAAIGTPITDAGAATWAVSLSASTSYAVITVTGEAGKNIQWHATMFNSVSGSGYDWSD